MISSEKHEEGKASRASRLSWLRWIVVVALLIAVGVILLPTLLSGTGVLQGLLNRRLAAHQIQASIGATHLGWLTPASFRDVRVADQAESWEFSAAELGSQLNLWQLLTSTGDLGLFVIDQPVVVVSIAEPINLPRFDDRPSRDRPPSRRSAQRFGIHVKDGTILVRVRVQEEPAEFAKQINIQADWHTTESGRELTIEPGIPLDHVQLTPEMCDTGLKYVAPILGDVAWSGGSLSLQLDHCQIPLDDPEQAEVTGRVSLHAVETGLKNPLAVRLAQVAAQALQKELPESIKLADDSVIEFQVKDAQVTHDGLEFGLPTVSPNLVIRTRGTVRFDGQLDLLAEIPLPLAMLGDGPLAQSLGNQTLSLPIQGSLDQPKLGLRGDGQMASEAISRLLDPVVSGDVKVDDVLDSIRELRQQRQERRDQEGTFLQRLRERRRARREEAQTE